MSLDNHIRVSKDTYKKLNARKDQGDTFDDVITDLLEEKRTNARVIDPDE